MKSVITCFAVVFIASAAFGQKNDTIYTVVEQPPLFVGGVPAMMKFISQNLRYPEEALKSDREGSVFIEFVIETDSSLSNFKVLKGIGSGWDDEAIRVIKLSNKLWKPGRQNGQRVRVRYILPINCILPSER